MLSVTGMPTPFSSYMFTGDIILKKLVGSVSDTIDTVLGKLGDGGTKPSYLMCPTDAISTKKVFGTTLGKDIPDGGRFPSGSR